MEILKSEEYKKEDLLFCLITELISKSDELSYVSDNENYLICLSNKGAPIWIWNKNDISQSKIDELVNEFDKFVLNDQKIQVTAKEKIYNILRDKYFCYVVDNYYIQKGSYVKMNAYRNDNPVLNKNIVGFRRRPNLDELETLKYYKKCDIEDTLTKEASDKITDKECLEIAKTQISNPNFYVWDVDGKIVSVASYHKGDKYYRISEVFTDRESRGKGYAGMLLYELCNEILNKEKVPMLYADANYISSNKAYQKIGFKNQGDLYTFKIDKTLKK